MKPAVLLAALVVSIVFGGCVDGSAASGNLDVGYAAFGPVVSENQGAIAGRVLDDKGAPIAGASVAIPLRKIKTLTDSEGRFAFNYLPLGIYGLNASAHGHKSKSMEVQVKPAEVSTVKLTLATIEVPVPYVTVDTQNLQVSYCYFDIFGFCSIISCSACYWTVPVRDRPTYFVFEVSGRHTVPKATGPDAWATSGYAEGTSTSNRGYMWSCRNILTIGTPPACATLPIKMGFANETFEDATAIRIQQQCEGDWVCQDDRYTDYASFFYNTPEDKVPPNYSAIPKS